MLFFYPVAAAGLAHSVLRAHTGSQEFECNYIGNYTAKAANKNPTNNYLQSWDSNNM